MRKDQQIDHKRLAKLETAQEPSKIKELLVTPNSSRNTPNPDDQYLKSIKLNVPTFDGHQDPQFSLN